jgi:hypothetical protein
MSGLFRKAGNMGVQPPPPNPNSDENKRKLEANTNREMLAQRRIRGKAATILTGGDGVTETASISRRTLGA